MKIFLKFRFPSRKFSLNEEQFLEYLEMLANDKSLDLNEVKTKLLAAGLPKVKNNEDQKQEEEEEEIV